MSMVQSSFFYCFLMAICRNRIDLSLIYYSLLKLCRASRQASTHITSPTISTAIDPASMIIKVIKLVQTAVQVCQIVNCKLFSLQKLQIYLHSALRTYKGSITCSLKIKTLARSTPTSEIDWIQNTRWLVQMREGISRPTVTSSTTRLMTQNTVSHTFEKQVKMTMRRRKWSRVQQVLKVLERLIWGPSLESQTRRGRR